MDAYFELMKFSNNIRLKTTNQNFEKCLDVINYIRVLNKMTIEQKDKKLFHIIHEAERDFPFQTSEFYSLEHD